MRPGVAAVALVLVLSGCNGLVAGGDGTAGPTVTPAPVPSPHPDRAASAGTPTECAAPRPATPDRSRASPTVRTPRTPVPIPTTDGVVAGERLIETNAVALRNHSYRLRTSDSIEVRTLPNASAFSYRGYYVDQFIVAYAVDGTLYTVDVGADPPRQVTRERYRPGQPGAARILPSEMVSFWLEDVVGPYNYTYAGTREWNGTTVRAFEAEPEQPQYVRLQEVVALNSTVYVDRRGIIRWIDHRQRYRNVLGEDNRTAWRNETLVVTRIGSVRIERPEGFCWPVRGG